MIGAIEFPYFHAVQRTGSPISPPQETHPMPRIANLSNFPESVCRLANPFVSGWSWVAFFCVAASVGLPVTTASEVEDREDGLQFYESKVRPLLIQHCYPCHSKDAKEVQGGLRVDSRQGLFEGGDSGPAIVEGDPKSSLLVSAVKHEALEMPPQRKLTKEEIAVFEQWITRGAPAPDETNKSSPISRKEIDWNRARQFWSFAPRRVSPVPIEALAAARTGKAMQADSLDEYAMWNRHPIDAYVSAKHQLAKLKPVPEAARHTWLRRVYFDLVGLPPEVDDYYEFMNDHSPDAYERVVDRLLSSVHYGERWGRHWLDLARYADSNGADENHAYPVAWRYRDYVFAAYNSDRPYDRFIMEQLAGDLLEAESEQQRAELLTATGFLVIGPKMLAEQDKPKLVADLVDEQLDTFGKVFLGLTLGCARCHDHKFDPITAADYYSLAGVFHSTKSMAHLEFVSQWNERELPNTAISRAIAEHQSQLQPAERALTDFELRIRDREFHSQLNAMLVALRECWTAIESPSRRSALAKDDVPSQESKRIEQMTARLNAMLDPKEGQQNNGASATEQFGALRIWFALRSVPHTDFQRTADELWQKLKAERTQASAQRSAWSILVGQLLSSKPPSRLDELLELYRTELEAAWLSVRSAQRDKDGKIRDPKLARTHRELFGKNSLLTYAEKIDELFTDNERADYPPLKERFETLKKAQPELERAMAVEDGTVKLVALHLRGSHLSQVGSPLNRRVPTVLQFEGSQEVRFPEKGSGRLELAKWLVDEQNPLTARVMANRIWQGHFGDGIVRTPSNFGTKGEPPTHPELLDWLADDFVRGEWSIKRMHRQIVLSATYRMDSISHSANALEDPDNRLLWRQNRRRLEVEPFRDSLLTICGELDRRIGGRAEMIYGEKFEETGAIKTIHDAFRRTVYLPINRAALEDFFSTFDYVDPGVSLEKRPATTVPHQALFLMNHRLPTHAAWQFAQRVQQATADPRQRIRLAFVISLGREPTDTETAAAVQYIDLRKTEAPVLTPLATVQPTGLDQRPQDPWLSFCRALLLTSEFIYVD